MNAWRIHQPAPGARLAFDEVAEPRPKPGGAVVRMRAIGLNSSEMQLINGDWEGPGVHVGRRLPLIPGIEGAGEIVAVGEGVTSLQPGDRVTVQYLWSCGECDSCVNGWENTCRNRRQWGRNEDGAYAEMTSVPAPFCIKIPENVRFEDAAALTCAGGTAWHMLMRHAELKAGETVLITGAASGIGAAAAQVAKLCGCRVIGTAGSDEKLVRLRAMGVDHVINHSASPDFTATVREMTDGRGVDVVFEVPGGATLPPALASMRPRGRLVLGGYMSGHTASVNIVAAIANEWRIFGAASWSRETLRTVLRLAGEGKLAPVFDSILPFDELPAGLERLQNRSVFGKVVITVP